MPMRKTKEVGSQYLELQPYSTRREQFEFYFPETGQFSHFPSNVSIGSKVTAKGAQNILNVEHSKTITSIKSFDDLLEAGTKEDILEFLSSKDLVNEAGFSFNKIYFLMKDKDFWLKTIDILRTKRIFEATIW